MDLFFMHWREISMNKKVHMNCKFFLAKIFVPYTWILRSNPKLHALGIQVCYSWFYAIDAVLKTIPGMHTNLEGQITAEYFGMNF
jgi:hypothetical protein